MTKSHYADVACMKNIYAFIADICTGLGYGDNFLAVLLSNTAMELGEFINPTHPITCELRLSAKLNGNS